MLVYREGKRNLDARAATTALEDALREGDALGVLLRAAELEGAYADAALPEATALAAVVDAAADAYLARTPVLESPLAHEAARRPGAPSGSLPVPPESVALRVSPPEGFVHYGVHPRDYADAAASLPVGTGPAVVVGLRTIGGPLSAVVAAALRRSGAQVLRWTERPTGHPFERWLSMDDKADCIQKAAAAGALFVVVDEGPGLSGSTFLAAAEALERAGAPRERIVLVPSYEPDLARLCARDAAARWSRYRIVPAGSRWSVPDEPGLRDVSGGEWRRAFGLPEERWPAVWASVERRKLLSSDGRVLYKLEGLGPWADDARRRAVALAARGFAPAVLGTVDGYVLYERIAGAPASTGSASMGPVSMGPVSMGPALLDHLVEYLAFRAEAFAVDAPATSALVEMVAVNTEALLGARHHVTLSSPRPCICDARLAPHEWVDDGARLVKTDGVWHGDDHFFPGPCDVAWDVVGAFVEWGLDADARAALTRRLAEALSDRTLPSRLPAWEVAYAAARAAHTKLARDGTTEPGEAARLGRDEARYRRALENAIRSVRPLPYAG